MEDSNNFEEFKQKLLGQYGILVGESRGRINYLPSDRTKPIRGRTLGTDFEREAIEKFFSTKLESAKITPITKPTAPTIVNYSLI